MGTLWQDVRYGGRMLARSPGFSLVVVALVAIGVGASTTVFSILNPILLRPLPYEDPDRIVVVEGRDRAGRSRAISHLDWLDWRREATSFEELSCHTFRSRPVSVSADEPPEECSIGRVSANFFQVFPVRPAAGRLLAPADDVPGATRVVVLGHAFWQRHFGADPNALGHSLVVEGASHTIIGVTPAGFDFLPYGADVTDVWVPIAPTVGPRGRAERDHEVLGRVKVGVSLAAAQAEMEAISARIAAEYPSNDPITSATVLRLHDSMGESIGHIPAILMGAVLMVFLVACANVAGLMFARGVTREREMALRSALGGTRLRLVRLILMEDVVLALLGGGLGVLVSTWVVQLLLAVGVLPAAAFPVGFFRPDWHVFGFALVLSIFGAPACGLAPSIRCSSSRLGRTLAAGSRSVLGSRGRNAAHTGLLAAQVALTIVLLVAAGLMIRSLFHVFTADRGFNSHNVLVMDLHLLGDRYASDQSKGAFHQQLLDQLDAIRGVEKAALTGPLFSTQSQRFHVEGETSAAPGQQAATASYRAVSPGYFQAMGIQLLRGRFFEDGDRQASAPVVIVDQTLALRYWPDGDWIGKRLKLSESDDPNVPWTEIVGVVRHVKDAYETQARMQVYEALFQKVFPRVSIVLRTARRPQDFVAAVKDAVYRIDRGQLISNPRTLDEALWYDTLVRRFVASLLSVSAGIALFLSAVGIYAVTRYSLARRTQEFGIRMALGADRSDVLRLVLRKALVPVLIGLGAGLVVTIAVARVLSSLLIQLSPWDPTTYVAVFLLLTSVTLLACYFPARQAARIDPMVALRYE